MDLCLVSKAHTFTVYRTGPVMGLASPTYLPFLQSLNRFAEGEDFQITIKPLTKRQGTQQQRYLHGVVIPDLAHASGISDPDDYEAVFQAMAWKFLRIGDHPFGYPRRRSTSRDDLSLEEMAAFIQQVIDYAESSIVGCRIRRPEEVDFDLVPDQLWR